MSKFNFLKNRTTSQEFQPAPKWDVPKVRIRAVGKDQFEGLRGHDYIAARNLSPQVARLPEEAAS